MSNDHLSLVQHQQTRLHSLPGRANSPDVTGDVEADDAAAGWQRLQTRQLLREFLRCVRRSEPDMALTIVRADGTARRLTRAQISAAVDALRPRQRQIVRLSLEERWPRERVCEYLNHISVKTFARDQAEALDLLAEL